MPDLDYTTHARDMLVERQILNEWIQRTINNPDKNWMGEDGNQHYTKAIPEREGRILHVVVNFNDYPNRIITLFFDRRLGKIK